MRENNLSYLVRTSGNVNAHAMKLAEGGDEITSTQSLFYLYIYMFCYAQELIINTYYLFCLRHFSMQSGDIMSWGI